MRDSITSAFLASEWDSKGSILRNDEVGEFYSDSETSTKADKNRTAVPQHTRSKLRFSIEEKQENTGAEALLLSLTLEQTEQAAVASCAHVLQIWEPEGIDVSKETKEVSTRESAIGTKTV